MPLSMATVNSNGIFHVYNLRAREKSFAVGEQVLILIPDSTSSKVFSRWLGPANVVEKKSPHSYINVKKLNSLKPRVRSQTHV